MLDLTDENSPGLLLLITEGPSLDGVHQGLAGLRHRTGRGDSSSSFRHGLGT